MSAIDPQISRFPGDARAASAEGARRSARLDSTWPYHNLDAMRSSSSFLGETRCYLVAMQRVVTCVREAREAKKALNA